MFNTIPIKMLACFITETDKFIPKFIWKCKKDKLAKQMNRVKGLILLAFRTYFSGIDLWKTRGKMYLRVKI